MQLKINFIKATTLLVEQSLLNELPDKLTANNSSRYNTYSIVEFHVVKMCKILLFRVFKKNNLV